MFPDPYIVESIDDAVQEYYGKIEEYKSDEIIERGLTVTKEFYSMFPTTAISELNQRISQYHNSIITGLAQSYGDAIYSRDEEKVLYEIDLNMHDREVFIRDLIKKCGSINYTPYLHEETPQEIIGSAEQIIKKYLGGKDISETINSGIYNSNVF